MARRRLTNPLGRNPYRPITQRNNISPASPYRSPIGRIPDHPATDNGPQLVAPPGVTITPGTPAIPGTPPPLPRDAQFDLTTRIANQRFNTGLLFDSEDASRLGTRYGFGVNFDGRPPQVRNPNYTPQNGQPEFIDDPSWTPSFSLGGETNDPFSLASRLRENLRQQRGRDNNSFGNRGQLYSGAFQGQLNEDDRQFNLGYNDLRNSLTDSLDSLRRRRVTSQIDRDEVTGQAGIDRVSRANVNPIPTPAGTPATPGTVSIPTTPLSPRPPAPPASPAVPRTGPYAPTIPLRSRPYSSWATRYRR